MSDKKETAPHKGRRQRRYTDEQLFELWQEGKTDAEMGAAVGVSRALIQRWRDYMELPSNKEDHLEPSSYTLEETPYGTFVVCDDHCTLGAKNRTCQKPGHQCLSCGWFESERDRREEEVRQNHLETDTDGTTSLHVKKNDGAIPQIS